MLFWGHRAQVPRPGRGLGRALGRLLVGLLMDSPLGINATWINTHDNEVADGLSRFKSNSDNVSNDHPTFDYSLLQQKYEKTLSGCRLWLPSSRRDDCFGTLRVFLLDVGCRGLVEMIVLLIFACFFSILVDTFTSM